MTQVTADAFHVAHQPAAPRGSLGRSLRYGTLILFEQTTYWDQYSSTDLWTIMPDGSNRMELLDSPGVYELSPDWQTP